MGSFVLALLLWVSGALSPAHGADRHEAHAALRTALVELVDAQSARTGESDPRYFDGRAWQSGNTTCWWCNTGFGTASAVLAGEASGPDRERYLGLARQTMNAAIRRYQRRSGGFAGSGGTSDGAATISFASELATTYLEIGAELDGMTRKAWRTSLRRATDYLAREGHTTWYINGNYNAAQTSVLFMQARISGSPADRVAYEASVRFLTDPPAPRWKGYGLVVDESSDQGYLTEQGEGRPGFDAEYTQLQLDYVARWYLASRDPRAARLIRLLLNKERGLVDDKWELRTDNGSRHGQVGRKVPFATPAVLIAGLDVAPGTYGRDVRTFVDRAAAVYLSSQDFTHPVLYRGASIQLAAAVKATE